MSCLIVALLGVLVQLQFDPSLANENATTNNNATTDPCTSYTEINEPWRNVAIISTTFKPYPNDDSNLTETWLRFVGIGGDRVVSTCFGRNVGGTLNTIYVGFAPHENMTTIEDKAYIYSALGCLHHSLSMVVKYCDPGDFLIYKIKDKNLPVLHSGFITYHPNCVAGSCGSQAQCVASGGCVCVPGFELLPETVPTSSSYGCSDIDECKVTARLCGPNGICTNNDGGYACSCEVGYEATNTSLDVSKENPCIDTDECLKEACGPYGKCTNNIGSYICICDIGFQLEPEKPPYCIDIVECLEEGLCGPNAFCTNNVGSYKCSCEIGYVPTNEAVDPSKINVCIDMDECERFTTVVDPFKLKEQTLCGPSCNCTNTIGSYYCTCFSGYRIENDKEIASKNNPCNDIDECVETPRICGQGSVCTNAPGSFYCSCPEKFYPNTGLEWIVGCTFCEYVQKRLSEMKETKGKTKEGVFFEEVNDQLNNLTYVPVPTLANGIAACMEVAGVGPLAEKSRVSSSGDGAVGTDLLSMSGRMVGRMVTDGYNHTLVNIRNSAMDLTIENFGYSGDNMKAPALTANGNSMSIDMDKLAEKNNGSAAAAFMTLNGMESLLSHNYLKTENRTEMLSDVVTALLPKMNNTNITDPVNFTIQHKKPMPEGSMVTCVYWKEEKNDDGLTTSVGWSTEGCSVIFSNENYTVCSVSHLSTFAIIMQIAEPPEQNDFLDWLNRICVIVGLFFFALAIVTFLLCSWNPKINNTARLHLCLNLGLFHLLMLWADQYTNDKLACKVLAGLLHFLIIGSFVWMQLEAVQLFMLVRKLTKVQVIKRDGLPRPLLYFVGYGVPMVIVGVSAVIYSDGYGATAGTCYLTTERHFNWAVLGPVITILGLNCALFGATLWSLRTTIANMRSGASDSKEMRLVLFKIVAQFVILGCTWILGLYQSNLFFQVLFIILNSQQGTFLYIVHCVLNKEIRDEYIKWLTCAFKKKDDDDDDDDDAKDVPSVSEDLDKNK